MRALLLLLLVLPLAGCTDHLAGRAPVVLVVESYQFEGDGLARGFAAMRCDLARLDLANRTAVRFGEPPGDGPEMYTDFLVVVDHGGSWRDHARNGSQGASVVAYAFRSGGGPFSWIGGSTSGVSGIGSPFEGTEADLYNVSWRDGRAWLDDAPLGADPVSRTFSYDVPTDAGTVRVTQTVTATYLGKLRIVDEAPPAGC